MKKTEASLEARHNVDVPEVRRLLSDFDVEDPLPSRDRKALRAQATLLLRVKGLPSSDRMEAHRVLALTEKGSAANQHFARALRLAQSQHAKARLLDERAVVLTRQGRRWAAAAAAALKAADLFAGCRAPVEKRAWAYAHAGQAYRGAGDWDRAAQSFRRAADLFRSDRKFAFESVSAEATVEALAHHNAARLVGGDPFDHTNLRHIGYASPEGAFDGADFLHRRLYEGALAYRRLGDPQRAIELLTELERQLGPIPTRLRVLTALQRAGATLESGEPKAAIAAHQDTIEIANLAPDVSSELHAQLLADLAYAAVVAGEPGPEIEAALTAAGAACDLADSHGYGLWAWSQLAKFHLEGSPDSSTDLQSAARVALSHWERACSHSDAIPSDRTSAANLLYLEAQIRWALNEPEASLNAAIRASRASSTADVITRARCAFGAAFLLAVFERFQEARTQTDIVRSVLARVSSDSKEEQEEIEALQRQANLIELRALDRSDTEPERTRARHLERRLLAAAHESGDHRLAGQVQNVLDGVPLETLYGGGLPWELGNGTDTPREPSDSDGAASEVRDQLELGDEINFEDQDDGFHVYFHADVYELVREARACEEAMDLTSAISFYERAYALQTRPAWLNDEGAEDAAAELARSIVSLRLDQGDLPRRVLPLLQEALDMATLPRLQIELLKFKATAWSRAGAFHAAIETFEQVLGLLSEESVDERASMLASLGEVCLRQGDGQRALDLLQEASSHKTLAPEIGAIVLQGRASIEHAFGREDAALALLADALSLVRDRTSSRHLMAMLLVDMGHNTDEHSSALTYYNEAIPLIEESGDKRHLVPALEGRLMARVGSGEIGAHEAADELSHLADLRRQNGDEEGEVSTLANAGYYFAEAGLPLPARQRFDEAIALARRIGASSLLAAALIGRAGIAGDSLQERHRALDYVGEACNIIESSHQALDSGFDRTDAIRERTIAFSLLAMLSADSGDTQGVLEATERVRALGLRDLISVQDMRSAAPEAARAEEEAAWVALETLWGNAEDPIDAAGKEVLQRETFEAQERLRRAEQRIRRALPSLAAAERIPRANLEGLQSNLLADGSALVSYTVEKSTDTLLVQCITDESDVWLMYEGLSVIEQLTSEFTASLAAGLPRPLHSHLLYQWLLAPLNDHIQARSLIIVPDGELHRLPFAALLTRPLDEFDAQLAASFDRRFADSAPGAPIRLRDLEDELRTLPRSVRGAERAAAPGLPWLIRSRSVRVVPSASIAQDLHLRAASQGSHRNFVGFADPPPPETHADPELEIAISRSAGSLGPLVHARREVREVAELLIGQPLGSGDRVERGPVSIRLGDQASREEFDRAMSQPSRWLHFACHALVDPERPWASRILLAPDSGRVRNLTAASVLRRQLPLDLVVLSCCDTGLGRIVPGEGILGLPRAFLASGARAVIATLWPVMDETAPELMLGTYRHLDEGLPPWEALRRAQLAEADRGVAANSWAAYFCVG